MQKSKRWYPLSRCVWREIYGLISLSVYENIRGLTSNKKEYIMCNKKCIAIGNLGYGGM